MSSNFLHNPECVKLYYLRFGCYFIQSHCAKVLLETTSCIHRLGIPADQDSMWEHTRAIVASTYFQCPMEEWLRDAKSSHQLCNIRGLRMDAVSILCRYGSGFGGGWQTPFNFVTAKCRSWHPLITYSFVYALDSRVISEWTNVQRMSRTIDDSIGTQIWTVMSCYVHLDMRVCDLWRVE